MNDQSSTTPFPDADPATPDKAQPHASLAMSRRGVLRFSMREAFWATAVVALTLAWWIDSRQRGSYSRDLENRVKAAESRVIKLERTLEQNRQIHDRAVELDRQVRQQQYEEILELREMLKQSIGDQRDWFKLQVSGNRIIGVGPATQTSPEVTPSTLLDIESATGLDASRLRHFMTPIGALKLRAKE